MDDGVETLVTSGLTVRWCDVVGAAERLYRMDQPSAGMSGYRDGVRTHYIDRIKTLVYDLGMEIEHDAPDAEYFGIPGVCYDIDGDWWHEPGSRHYDREFDEWLMDGGRGGPMPTAEKLVKCCGVVGVDNRA